MKKELNKNTAELSAQEHKIAVSICTKVFGKFYELHKVNMITGKFDKKEASMIGAGISRFVLPMVKSGKINLNDLVDIGNNFDDGFGEVIFEFVADALGYKIMYIDNVLCAVDYLQGD